MAIVDRGRDSHTDFRVLEALRDSALVEATLHTGRTHQIRVHLASQGHAIVGDDKYGDFDLNKRLHKLGMRRMFLHAWRLQFTHPATGERVLLNDDQVLYVEATHDTLLVMATGERLRILESPEEFIERVAAWRQRIMGLSLVHEFEPDPE